MRPRGVHRRRGACLTSLAAVLLVGAAPVSAAAQALTTVSGTVLNEGGRPMEYVQVTLDPDGSNRQVRTDRDGRFGFAGVPNGRHVLRTTWVGHEPDERAIEAAGGVLTVEITLRRLTTLGGVEITARRTGLFGTVVATDSLRPVPRARIEVIGARQADSTNMAGVFNLPDIKPGAYLVRVRHPFFQSRNVPVVVPNEGAAEVDIVVEPGNISRDQHMEMLYREMDSRLAFKGQHAAMVTREELRGREKMSLDVALQMVPRFSGRQFLFTTNACVFVDGLPRPGAKVTDFAPEDIEAVEVYGATFEEVQRNPLAALQRADPTGSLRNRWPPRMQCGDGVPYLLNGGMTIPRSRIVSTHVLIWLRK